MSQKSIAGYKMTSSRTADKFVVRLPDGMRADIDERASKSGYSMNNKIILLMKAGMDLEDGLNRREAEDKSAYEAAAESWNPAEKQLVVLESGNPGIIHSFFFETRLMAEVRPLPGSNWEKSFIPVEDLKPLLVKPKQKVQAE